MSDDLVKRLLTPMKGVTVQQVFKERAEAADRIEELEAETAKLRADMHTAMNAVAEAARARGEAEGKLAASETAGVLEGWIEKCAVLEAKLAKAVDALTQIERAYYQEATNPSPETVRRMAARMNGIARDTQNALAELTGGKDD